MTLIRPDTSFVAKCQGLKKTYVCGVYAVSCSGPYESYSSELIASLKEREILPLCQK